MSDIMDLIASTVIFLFSADQNPYPIGTAFIVGYPFPEKKGNVIPLVVTAKHVIGDRKKILGRFSTEEGSSTTFVHYDIGGLKKSNDYWEYPGDDGVDLAVFRSLHFKGTKYGQLPMDLIATKKTFEEHGIHQTDRVIFPSLLSNFMGLSQNYPVFRSGTIALIPKEKVPMEYKVGSRKIVTKQEVIFADATSVPGASGSPIFLRPGPRLKGKNYQIGGTIPYLLGIMHGFYPATPREILEIQTTGTKTMYSENSGIAIMFPSWKLHDILEDRQLKKRIQEIAKTEAKK